MRRKLLFGLVLTMISSAAMADETRGPVVYAAGCGSRIVIQTPQGYVVAVWLDGVAPRRGETLVGEFSGFGNAKAYNVNTDGGGTIRIEEFGLSRGRAMQVLKNRCR